VSIVLSPQEIADLTDRVRTSAQARQLAHMGIPYTPRTDGSLAVLRVHVESLIAAAARRDEKPRPRVRFD
jgi:hypothetical protein